MKKKKLTSLILAACLTLTALTGCGNSSNDAPAADTAANTSAANSSDSSGSTASADISAALDALPAAIGEGTITATPEMYANTDLSTPYTVNMYLIGDTPNDWDRVLELTNKYLEPFNTQLAVTFMSWSDYQTMYSLVLAGGEQVDLIFTAPWCYMYSEAPKGSFYVLTDDFIADHMPLANKYQDKESWDETTISGQTIAVPANQAQAMGKIVAIRQDIAEKYGINELKSWEDYMNYMQTVAKNETPESGIYAEAASGDNNELWDVYRQQYDTFLALDSDYLDLIYEYNGSISRRYKDCL